MYAQDNETSWVDWTRAAQFEPLTRFVGRLADLRHDHPVLHRRRHFRGRGLRDEGLQDIGWFTPTGEWMTAEDWNTAHIRSVAVLLNGSAIREPDARGEPVVDDSFFILFNGHYEPIKFALPDIGAGDSWTVEIDTTTAEANDTPSYATGEGIAVPGRSILVLRGTD